jgi:hypothetical protein
MAEHGRVGKSKLGDSEQKRYIKKEGHQPSSEMSLTRDQNLLVEAATFNPPIQRHAALLSKASSEQRVIITRQLQQTYGNRYVQRLLQSVNVQAKLTVGAADDPFELEADDVADKVMNMQTPQTTAQRQIPEEEEELQPKPITLRQPVDPSKSFEAGSNVEQAIQSQSGGGSPLPGEVRSFMEPRFGADFSNVHVHAGSDASQLNKELSAQAFTHGQDIFMGEWKYNPGTVDGKRLLAHELTHVVQQTGGKVRRQSQDEEELQAKPVSDARRHESGIYRQFSAGFSMVITKTYLLKPNSRGNAPAKSLFTSNKIGEQLQPNDALKLLDVKSPAKEPKWQLAKNPKTGETGFIKIRNIMGGSSSLEKDEKPETEIPNDLKTVDNIKDITSSLSELFGGTSGVNEGIFEDAAKILILKDPELAWSLNAGDTKDKVASIEKHVPWLKEALSSEGTKWAGVGAGLLGDSLGIVSGLVGMGKGIHTMFSNTSEMNERVEGFVTVGTGALGIGSSLFGIGSTSTGAVASVVGEDSLAGGLFKSISEFLKPVGDAIKTLKGGVETVVQVVKGLSTLIQRAKKGVGTKLTEVLSWLAEFAGSVMGTLKSAFMTASGILNWLQKLPGVSAILGIIGSVIDVVSSVCEFIKNVVETVSFGIEMKGQKESLEKIEKADDYKRIERNMGDKLRNLSQDPHMPLKLTEENQPDVVQIGDVLQKYEKTPKKDKDYDSEKDYQDVKAYLVDRSLKDVQSKRINRGYSRIPEFVMSLIASGISILGGLVSVGSDIAGLISSPSGIGLAIATATKAITSIVTTVFSGALKLGKSVYSLARTGVRKIKQHGTNKGWWGDKSKSTGAKDAKRLQQTKLLMEMVADLNKYNPAYPKSREKYERVQLRLEAAGVDLKELFSMNGKPLDQAKEIYKALAKRE